MDNYRVKQKEDTERYRYYDNFFWKKNVLLTVYVYVYIGGILLWNMEINMKNKLITGGYWEGKCHKRLRG